MRGLKNRLTEKLSDANELSTVEDNTNGTEKDNNLVLLKNHQSQNLSAVPDFAISINEAKNRIAMLQDFVKEMMIPDVDYGLVPGSKKPSLFKSGAEKLTDIFGLSKHVEVLNRLEDWENKIFHYEVKVTLINKRTGLVEAEGIGSCNTKEKKYASNDACSLINTVLKMAKKRAIVDAVLSATRTSGLFAQDLEDMELNLPQSNKGKNINAVNASFQGEKSQESIPKMQTVNNNEPPTTTNQQFIQQQQNEAVLQPPIKSASKSQLSLIFRLVEMKIVTVADIKQLLANRYNVSESKCLSSSQASDLIKYLTALNKSKTGVH